jgi:beta-glucosidase
VSAAYNNSGISDNSSPSSANLDGAGDSFSEQSLEAVGLSPGATVTAQGISYTWPDVGPGLPDNISLAGQTLLVQASGGTLGFLGTADFGKQTATGTITYTDGTTQTFTLTYPDWFADSATGTNDQLVATGVLNGTFAGTHVGVYAAEVPLDSGKTVAAVTLPNDSDMHVFAMNAG